MNAWILWIIIISAKILLGYWLLFKIDAERLEREHNTLYYVLLGMLVGVIGIPMLIWEMIRPKKPWEE